jgi:hypothetical protein
MISCFKPVMGKTPISWPRTTHTYGKPSLKSLSTNNVTLIPRMATLNVGRVTRLVEGDARDGVGLPASTLILALATWQESRTFVRDLDLARMPNPHLTPVTTTPNPSLSPIS